MRIRFQEDALKLQEALEYDDEGATNFSSVDDEYKYAGVEDPKVSSQPINVCSLFRQYNALFKAQYRNPEKSIHRAISHLS